MTSVSLRESPWTFPLVFNILIAILPQKSVGVFETLALSPELSFMFLAHSSTLVCLRLAVAIFPLQLPVISLESRLV